MNATPLVIVADFSTSNVCQIKPAASNSSTESDGNIAVILSFPLPLIQSCSVTRTDILKIKEKRRMMFWEMKVSQTSADDKE